MDMSFGKLGEAKPFGDLVSLEGLSNHDFKGAEVQLLVKGQTYVADFTGHVGLVVDPAQLAQFRAGAVTNGTTRVEILIQEYMADGVGADIGRITTVRDPNRVPPPSTLTAIAPGRPFPAILDFLLNLHVTIPNLLPRITLRNKTSKPGAAILRNPNVTNFPPDNDVYQLVEPIELEDVNNPGPVLATIRTFPVTFDPAPRVPTIQSFPLTVNPQSP
jgi:hypothetical protein